MRLYLGITREPHFFHVHPSSGQCTDLPEPNQEAPAPTEETSYIERNGFRVPVSRSIQSTQTATVTRETVKKLARPLKVTKTFVATPAFTLEQHDHSYLAELARHGFTLDKSQAEAVSDTEGPLLVLARSRKWENACVNGTNRIYAR